MSTALSFFFFLTFCIFWVIRCRLIMVNPQIFLCNFKKIPNSQLFLPLRNTFSCTRFVCVLVFQFGGLESPLTGLRDEFYRVFRHRWAREVLTLIIVVSAFLFSIPCMTVVSIIFLNYGLRGRCLIPHRGERIYIISATSSCCYFYFPLKTKYLMCVFR